MITVQHARRNADHVLRRRAHLVADEIIAKIKANEFTGELAHQPLLGGGMNAVDHHAVGNAPDEFLHMARPQPHSDLIIIA